MVNFKLESKPNPLCTAFLLIVLQTTHLITTADDFSDHIQNCCNGGKTLAKKQNNCETYEYNIMSISPLWRGLCVSTYAVCCSHELEKIYCASGRLAALTGSRCNEQHNSTSYSDCCRACQIGLAVKASGNSCSDAYFDYFSDIKSFQHCCGEINDSRLDAKPSSNLKGNNVTKKGDNMERSSQENADGTIILGDDDDDICGKFPLCEQICENTIESYVCKCHTGFKLSDNMVTCIPISDYNATSERIETLTPDNSSKALNLNEFVVVDEKNNSEADGVLDSGAEENELDETVEQTCPKGFRVDPFKPSQCMDINECLLKISDCKFNQICVNLNGGFRCINDPSKACDYGFFFNKDSNICKGKNMMYKTK